MQFSKRANWFVAALALFLISLIGEVNAQSLDINAPAPVHASALTGSITARDIGDARFTDHYYRFAANPGDLLITIESKNLNGDIDVFTAGTLRPLLKFSVYAESAAPVSKEVFLRKREDLILRVQARSPNDDEGTYQIKFGGSFEPVAAPTLAEDETPVTEAPSTVATSGDRKVKRVTSSGARIYEPEPPPAEVAAAPTPEPSPETPAETTPTETPTETPAPTSEQPVETPKATTPRSSRNRRPTNRRTRSRPPAETARTAEEPAKTSTPTESTAEPQEEIGPRLVIETRDGTLINRSMMTVRRVMVENGQVVVVGRDGRVQRIQLVDVVKMTIAPE